MIEQRAVDAVAWEAWRFTVSASLGITTLIGLLWLGTLLGWAR